MNLIEIPFGPVTPSKTKTLEVVNSVYDPQTKREVERKFIITGSDAFGLPKPIDDQVIIGLNTITAEQGFAAPKVHFSRHELCLSLGWAPDGRAYKRIEESLDRIAGTTLKFRNAWWDKGEQEWRSHTFHLITNVELCSTDRYQRIRAQTKQTRQRLCSFVWNEVVWKSLLDGHIRRLDMVMFRKIANGRRREVPVRLFRVLGKRLWKKQAVTLRLEKLCVRILGLQTKYPSQMRTAIERASAVLIDVGFLGRVTFKKGTVTFYKPIKLALPASKIQSAPVRSRNLEAWFESQDKDELLTAEQAAIAEGFGSNFEIRHVRNMRGQEFIASMRIRLLYVQRYLAEREVKQRVVL